MGVTTGNDGCDEFMERGSSEASRPETQKSIFTGYFFFPVYLSYPALYPEKLNFTDPLPRFPTLWLPTEFSQWEPLSADWKVEVERS